MSHSISFISVINYITTFKKPCELLEFSLSTRPILFQFFEDFIHTHAAGQQLLQHSLCFGLLQSSLLLFQCVLLLFNRFLDRCDLGIQRRNSLLLLYDLGCIVFGDIGFRTVFATFRSGHGDNLFSF